MQNTFILPKLKRNSYNTLAWIRDTPSVWNRAWHREGVLSLSVEWMSLGIVALTSENQWLNQMVFIAFFFFINFISFRTGSDNECWYFLLFVIIINIILKWLFFPLLSGLLHLGVWNNPGSKGTVTSPFFFFSCINNTWPWDAYL